MSDLQKKDSQNIWHPFTQMKLDPFSIPVISGKGSLLVDENGNEYIDAVSSWWVNMHGHAHPYIAKAIYDQYLKLEHSIFAGFTHKPAIDLSEKLLEIVPGPMHKIFFSDNGSTAVEVGIKMALQYWHNKGNAKTRIIALDDAYHGDTFGAMSISARGPFNEAFQPLLFDVETIPPPIPGNETACIVRLKKILNTHKDIAAIIFEPLVMGAGGMIMYSPESLDEIISLCKENDILCIADEVMTGFGRTGKMFACEHLKNKIDIMAVSKGITGGSMALGVTLCQQHIYDAFLSDNKLKAFFHGHSYTANPLACSASIASLELFVKEETLNKINKINQWHEGFITELKKNKNADNIRVRGTILAFDLVTGQKTSYFNNIRDKVYRYFLDQGVLLRPLGNVIYIMPPYCISKSELRHVYDTILNMLNKI